MPRRTVDVAGLASLAEPTRPLAEATETVRFRDPPSIAPVQLVRKVVATRTLDRQEQLLQIGRRYALTFGRGIICQYDQPYAALEPQPALYLCAADIGGLGLTGGEADAVGEALKRYDPERQAIVLWRVLADGCFHLVFAMIEAARPVRPFDS